MYSGGELVARTRADGEPEVGRLKPSAAGDNHHVYPPPVGRGRAERPRSPTLTCVGHPSCAALSSGSTHSRVALLLAGILALGSLGYLTPP